MKEYWIHPRIIDDCHMFFVSDVAEDVDILHFLTLLLFMPQPSVLQLALRLFFDLNFILEEYETIIDRVQRLRTNYPEAEQLIEKVERMRLDQEMVDEFIEEDERDEDEMDEDEEDDSFEEELSFSDDDSGFSSDSEEHIEEQYEEERQRIQQLEQSVHHLCASVLSWGIRSGNAERIVYTMEILDFFELAPEMYEEYHIAELIEKHGAHCEEALQLLQYIKAMIN